MESRLREGTEEALIYAALELRCGVESRLKEYIETIEHIPKAQKKEWAVAKLGRSLESAYRTGDKIMIFTIRLAENAGDIQLLYTPVTKRLQDIANRVGDFLHAVRHESVSNPDWWKELRGLLDEAYPLLKLATSGQLIGLPLLHRPTKTTTMRVVFEGEGERSALVAKLAQGETHVVSVQYIDPIPGTFTFYES
ncbi:hypothetical protein [Zoogloea sp.]|uniref:hypothetical protein n=1 Tax=Zoogloea sp. TaxID=49181 RepID=UPI0035B20B85